MIGIFTKPVELLTSTDVDELIAQSWPEGYEVEFKGALPHKKGGTHPWINGGGLDAEFAIEVALGSRGGFPSRYAPPRPGDKQQSPRQLFFLAPQWGTDRSSMTCSTLSLPTATTRQATGCSRRGLRPSGTRDFVT